MEHSGIAGYRRLKDLDPELCQAIVRFSEDMTAQHDLPLAVSIEVKQALCQFALDMATRYATDYTLGIAWRRRKTRKK